MIQAKPSVDIVGAAMQGLTLNPPKPPAGKAAPAEKWELYKVKSVQNVHQDDIHAIIKLSDKTLVTGSKDGSLKKWDFDCERFTTLKRPSYIDYKRWITALAVLNDQFWVSGNREGSVDLWDTAGNFIKNIIPPPNISPSPDEEYTCKDRNINRVSCLTSFCNYIPKKLFFFAGWRTQFTFQSADKRRLLSMTKTDENDWVYVIQPLSQRALLVVTGCRLDLFLQNRENRVWSQETVLIAEGRRTAKNRPFISAVTPLKDRAGLYGVAVFDSSVRVIDVEARKTIFHGQEHQNRVWAIENLQPFCFASSADDGYIKLWDIRQPPKSTFSVLDNEGDAARVSVLLQLGEFQLLSASCPNDIRRAKNKAQFSCWDIRR